MIILKTGLSGQKVAITGGAGFIGSHLCDALLYTDLKELRIIDDLSASTINNIQDLMVDERLVFDRSNIVNYEVILRHIIDVDLVFHLAASNVGNSLIDSKTNLETNIIGTHNVLMAARKNPSVKIVYVSSGSVVNPSTPYAISKMAAENYCRFFAKEYGTKVVIMRPFHVFGPRQDYGGKCGVINIFLHRILQGLPPVIWGSGEQVKCFTYVEDVVNAMMTLAISDSIEYGKIYEVASGTRITIKELANMLVNKYTVDKNIIPIYGEEKVGENMLLNPDIIDIYELGWKPEYTFEEGLERCKMWVEEQIKLYESSSRTNLS